MDKASCVPSSSTVSHNSTIGVAVVVVVAIVLREVLKELGHGSWITDHGMDPGSRILPTIQRHGSETPSSFVQNPSIMKVQLVTSKHWLLYVC